MSNTLDTLFDDIEANPLPLESKLTFVIELDTNGDPMGYMLAGDVIDHDGAVFGVAEYTPNFDRAWNYLMYYTHEFDNVSVNFESKTIKI